MCWWRGCRSNSVAGLRADVGVRVPGEQRQQALPLTPGGTAPGRAAALPAGARTAPPGRGCHSAHASHAAGHPTARARGSHPRSTAAHARTGCAVGRGQGSARERAGGLRGTPARGTCAKQHGHCAWNAGLRRATAAAAADRLAARLSPVEGIGLVPRRNSASMEGQERRPEVDAVRRRHHATLEHSCRTFMESVSSLGIWCGQGGTGRAQAAAAAAAALRWIPPPELSPERHTLDPCRCAQKLSLKSRPIGRR